MDAKKSALKAKIRAAKKSRQGKSSAGPGVAPAMPDMNEISSMIKTLSDNPDMMKSLMNLGGMAAGDMNKTEAVPKTGADPNPEPEVTFVSCSNVAVQLGSAGLMCVSNDELDDADVIEYGVMVSEGVYSGCGGLYRRSEGGNATLKLDDMGEFTVFTVLASKEIKSGAEIVVST